MVTVDDVSPGERLPDPMVVEVTDVIWRPGPSRRAEVELADTVGNPFRLIDYEGANISIEWRPGYSYLIDECGTQKGKRGFKLELTPGPKTEISSLGAASGKVQLLVVGDTHIGRSLHPGTGVSINPLDAFATAVAYGIEQDVDAVVHVGDLFHESATPSRAALVQKKIFAKLAIADIPFYYIRGNHARQSSDELFSMVDTEYMSRLDTTGVAIGSTVRLFGIDHSPGGNLPWSTFTFPDTVSEPVSILILHQTLQQLSGVGPTSVDLDRILQQFGDQFDAVFSGHHHDAIKRDYNGVPLFYTGAAEHMSKNENPDDRIAWIVQVENESVSINRYDIPE